MLANVFRGSKTICKCSACNKYSLGMIQSFAVFIHHPLQYDKIWKLTWVVSLHYSDQVQ
jgi:hypothetical protein